MNFEVHFALINTGLFINKYLTLILIFSDSLDFTFKNNKLDSIGAFAPLMIDYFQVQFTTLSTVVGVQTAGLQSTNEYVKTFRLKYSVDCSIFNDVGNNLVIHYFSSQLTLI